MNKPPALFWDFDETLINSLYATDEKHADKLLDEYSELWRGEKFKLIEGWYVVFLRSFSNEILTYSRELVGHDNVYVLSTGTYEYITSINHVLGLGFNPNTNMFGREHIKGDLRHRDFKDTHNVLVDNEDWWFHNSGKNNKVKFLDRIPESRLITVPRFEVQWGKEILGDFVSDLKLEIAQAFELLKPDYNGA